MKSIIASLCAAANLTDANLAMANLAGANLVEMPTSS
ncbi:MAG: pentapeptide repeat-containing protein [Actinomycetota bacterium]